MTLIPLVIAFITNAALIQEQHHAFTIQEKQKRKTMLSVLPQHSPLPLTTASDAEITNVASIIDTHSLRKTLNLHDTTINDDDDDNNSNDPPPLLTEQNKPWIVGHRGALYQELENTLEGFRYCADLGIEAVELDVFLVAGELVVFHGGGTDENPGDLTDYCRNQLGKSILDMSSLDEIQSLEFNPDCPEFGVEDKTKIRHSRIPTLRQVLELAKRDGRMIIKIELKGPGVTIPTLKLVQEMGLERQCHYSSFHHARIALVRQIHPERDPRTGDFVYKTGALFHGRDVPSTFIQDAKRVGASEVHLQYDDCTTDRIQQIHKAGMGSMAYFRGPIGMQNDMSQRYWDVGMEDARMYESVLQTGVEQMCCNRPDVLKEVMAHM